MIAGVHNASIVRFGGDITVSGTVNGDVVSIGGNVRLEPRASVTGKVMTFLGDVNLPADTRKVGGVSAVLGRFHSDEKLGTAAQLQNRNPKLKIMNISCFSDASFNDPQWEKFNNLGDYIIMTNPDLKLSSLFLTAE